MSNRRRRGSESGSENNDDNSGSDSEADVPEVSANKSEPGESTPLSKRGETKPTSRRSDGKKEKRDPAHVPRLGGFFLHDDRDAGEVGSPTNRNRADDERGDSHRKERPQRKKASDDAWSHDKFQSLDEEKPKTSSRSRESREPRPARTSEGKGASRGPPRTPETRNSESHGHAKSERPSAPMSQSQQSSATKISSTIPIVSNRDRTPSPPRPPVRSTEKPSMHIKTIVRTESPPAPIRPAVSLTVTPPSTSGGRGSSASSATYSGGGGRGGERSGGDRRDHRDRDSRGGPPAREHSSQQHHQALTQQQHQQQQQPSYGGKSNSSQDARTSSRDNREPRESGGKEGLTYQQRQQLLQQQQQQQPSYGERRDTPPRLTAETSAVRSSTHEKPLRERPNRIMNSTGNSYSTTDVHSANRIKNAMGIGGHHSSNNAHHSSAHASSGGASGAATASSGGYVVQGPSRDEAPRGAAGAGGVTVPQTEWKSSRNSGSNSGHSSSQQQQQQLRGASTSNASGDVRQHHSQNHLTTSASTATGAAHVNPAAPASPNKPPGLDMPVLKATARAFEPSPSSNSASVPTFNTSAAPSGATEYGGTATKSVPYAYPDPSTYVSDVNAGNVGGGKYSTKQSQQHQQHGSALYATTDYTGTTTLSPRDASAAAYVAAPAAGGYGIVPPQDITLDAYGNAVPLMYATHAGYHHYTDATGVHHYADPNAPVAYGDSSALVYDASGALYHTTAEGHVPMAAYGGGMMADGSGTVWYSAAPASDLPTGTVYYPPPPPSVTSSSAGYYGGSGMEGNTR